jgi:hypothetical protein
MPLPRAARAALALLALLGPPGAPAAGEIFRCRQADGSLTFTSDPSTCAGRARVHEPTREIQVMDQGRAPRSAPASPAPSPGASPASPPGSTEDAQAAMWARKKSEAEQELARLEGGLEEFRQLVAWCNRGGGLVVEDSVGLRRDYSCEDARAAYEKMEPRIEFLRDYLDHGLAEECRRSGCLPGWIR